VVKNQTGNKWEKRSEFMGELRSDLCFFPRIWFSHRMTFQTGGLPIWLQACCAETLCRYQGRTRAGAPAPH
jgi:hypothetical protein